MTVAFETWTDDRDVASLGTNSGAPKIAFQAWRHFKEAFAPELVARAISDSAIEVKRCIDPFGGSGTTSLACQFLGVEPLTVEVNPYLADLIRAKLASYDSDALAADFKTVVARSASSKSMELPLPSEAPATLVEPGLNERWVFDAGVASRLAAILHALDGLANEQHQLLFRVLLGGILLEVSNVVVNGKGRRYRGGWQERRCKPQTVDRLFAEASRNAIADIHRFANRACSDWTVVGGDAREALGVLPDEYELAVFSPPYPNSFDYTDVYNLELWVLGYLDGRPANRELRQSTLCSHVQIDREYPEPPESALLAGVLDQIRDREEDLWHRRLPDMVGGYFADLQGILKDMHDVLHRDGSVWMVVGDSRYAGILVPTAEVLTELAQSCGYRVRSSEAMRSMRASAQQGGNPELAESLLVLAKD